MIKPATNRLEEIRKSKGLGRGDLAVALGVTEDTIRRFDENRGGPIPSKYIPQLVAMLETTSDYLMGWDRQPATTGKAA